MGASTDNGMDNTGDDTPAQHSSKLSLGSSPSVLSGDEDDDDDDDGLDDQQHNTGNELYHSTDEAMVEDQENQDNDGNDTTFTSQSALTPTDKLLDEDTYDQHEDDDTDKTGTAGATHVNNEQEDDGDDDMDDLFDGPLLPSTGELDDMNMDQDSASPLSSVPDDFPLSRSVSPELQDNEEDGDDPLLLLAASSAAVPPPRLSHSPTSTPTTVSSKQNHQQRSVSSSASTASASSSSPSTSPPPPPQPTTNGSKRKHDSGSLVGESSVGDDQNEDNLFDNNSINSNSTAHTIKSRRLSMTGRDIYGRSSMNTGLMGEDDTIEEKDEEEEEEDDDEDEDDNEVDTHVADTSTDQMPLTSNHDKESNKTTATLKNSISPSSKSPSTKLLQEDDEGPPPQDSGISDQGPRDTDDHEQENGNGTMRAPNQTSASSHVDDSILNTDGGTQSALYGESERPSTTSEEDHDNQQRHKDALEALTHIEVEFGRLRDKMYQEKMAELNEEAMMIANGTHPELVTLMTEIEEKKGRRIRTAEAWRKYQHANFEKQFEGFEYQANVHFISRKSSIRRELLASTNGKRWRLEDEQGKLNDPLQKPGKLLPDAHTLRLQKQRKQEETMDLQHIKDVIGFPRAPQVPDLPTQDIRDDLLLLGLGPSRPH